MWQKFERRLLPEMDKFPSRIAADSALETAKKRRPMLWVALVFILIGAGYVFGRASVSHYLVTQGTRWEFIAHAILVILFHVLTAYCGLRLFVAPIRKSLRQSLQAKGIPICIPCGYDLRGQTETRCPECGAPFDAHLVSQIITDDQPS